MLQTHFAVLLWVFLRRAHGACTRAELRAQALWGGPHDTAAGATLRFLLLLSQQVNQTNQPINQPNRISVQTFRPCVMLLQKHRRSALLLMSCPLLTVVCAPSHTHTLSAWMRRSWLVTQSSECCALRSMMCWATGARLTTSSRWVPGVVGSTAGLLWIEEPGLESPCVWLS